MAYPQVVMKLLWNWEMIFKISHLSRWSAKETQSVTKSLDILKSGDVVDTCASNGKSNNMASISLWDTPVQTLHIILMYNQKVACYPQI